MKRRHAWQLVKGSHVDARPMKSIGSSDSGQILPCRPPRQVRKDGRLKTGGRFWHTGIDCPSLASVCCLITALADNFYDNFGSDSQWNSRNQDNYQMDNFEPYFDNNGYETQQQESQEPPEVISPTSARATIVTSTRACTWILATTRLPIPHQTRGSGR